MIFKILILDDEQLVCNSLKRIIESETRQVYIASTFDKAKEILNHDSIDLLLLDYKLKEIDGVSVLKELNEKFENLLVIMITAYGNIDIAVDAMKLGAYDFIQKKVEPDFLRFTVQRALDNLRLKKEVDELKTAFRDSSCSPKIVAVSSGMKKILKLATEYAKTDSTVLIGGETGTGKSVLAEFIHYKSSRFNQQFIPINVSAIPKELIESELFGYEKGAFTGASPLGKAGLIERANNGTLFLDEIGDLGMDIQAKLLHVLDKNEFYRLGAVKPTDVNVRFITATNVNIEEMVNQKKFRMDLYYRINIAQMEVPSLRNRFEDILPLTKYFIDEFNGKFNKSVTQISDEAEFYLKSEKWRGNVRELKNKIERAILLSKEVVLTKKELSDQGTSLWNNNHYEGSSLFSVQLNIKDGTNILHEAEKQIISQALKLAENNITKASQMLGVPRTTLNFYLKKYQIHN